MKTTEKVEISVLIIKPGSEQYNGLPFRVGDMIAKNDFHALVCQKVMLSVEFCKEFYSCHVSKPYFGEMLKHLTSGPSFVLLIKGEDAVRIVREFVVKTRETHGKNAKDSDNVLHGSDLVINAKRERKIVKKFLPHLKKAGNSVVVGNTYFEEVPGGLLKLKLS